MTDETHSPAADSLPAKPNGKPFVKGYDPRRNLRGTPKDAITARKLFRQIAAELLTIREKNERGEAVEYDITRLEAAIRLKFGSRAPKDFETILKALFPGLLKDEVDVTSGGKAIVEIVNPKIKTDEI
jgi:hypothetical protein